MQDDLHFFEPRLVFDNAPSIDAALAMTEKLRLRGIENPIALLGYLYVLEGSTLGNSIHKPDISSTFHFDGLSGCRYYSSYRDRVKESWKRFTEKMNNALDDHTLHDQIIASAHEAFSGLETIYKALYPLEKKKKTYHVTRINPEAGNHPVPDDEREIQAALKASNRGWAEFPYYEHRYGERGKRFSDSDTCWLVTLTALDQASMQKQIEWIGRVLATRGMPSIMLEHTLRILHEELVIAVPNSRANYGKLLNAAEMLKGRRNDKISEKAFEKLSSEFDQAVGPQLAKEYKNTGKLVLSSVTDEKNGIEGAVSALQEWVGDKARFPDKWISAVSDTLNKARGIASRAHHETSTGD